MKEPMLDLKARRSKVDNGNADANRETKEGVEDNVLHPVCEQEQGREVLNKTHALDFIQPWHVFVNQVDSYHTAKVTDLLLERAYDISVFGAHSKSLIKDERREENTEEEEKEVAVDEKEEENEETGHERKYREASKGNTKRQFEIESLRKFEIVATSSDPKHICEGIRIIPSLQDDKEKFISEIMKCGFIIYDITQNKSQIQEVYDVIDELLRVIEEQQKLHPRTFISNNKIYHFILISSLLTWARTKRDSEPLTDSNYRKRKPHPNFRELLECERYIATVTRRRDCDVASKLKTRVVCSGVTYGEGEALLHYAFKLGWSNEAFLPVVGNGDNLVPLIHVRDLASAIFAVMKNWPKSRYIIAAETKTTTQKSIIKTISSQLCTGHIKFMSTEEIISTYPEDITQPIIDAITLNLPINPTYLSEPNSAMVWTYGPYTHFCESISNIVREYRTARNLQPLRLIILGPPASGKSMVARALAKYYQLHYVALKRLIADTIQQLVNEVNNSKNVEMNSQERNEKPEENDKEDTLYNYNENPQYLLNEIRNNIKENDGRLDDDVLTKIFRRKLTSRECQNQGYIIDGYPKTLSQARLLFELYDEKEQESISSFSADRKVNSFLPELVVAFDAKDEFLMERIINLSERELRGTNYTEEHMAERLRLYRERNEEESTPLQLFDELEIHPVILNVEEDKSLQMLQTFQYCQKLIGPPRNYGSSSDEIAEEKKRAEMLATIEAMERKRLYSEQNEEREKRSRDWMNLMRQLKEEEEKRLSLMAEPLRHYLVRHVFPILTQGLAEVARLRPDEPIDYLAEFLFKMNPEARAFEPDYTQKLSATISSIEQLQKAEATLRGPETLSDYGVYELLSFSAEREEGESLISCECLRSEESIELTDAQTSSHECLQGKHKCCCEESCVCSSDEY